MGMTWARRRSTGLVLCALTLAFGSSQGAGAQEPPELAVKAAFLYKFGPFVSWPAASFDSPSSPFSLCIVGDDPFGPMLDGAVANQRVGGRPIVVRRMAKADRKAPCQILYAGGSPPNVKDTLQAVAGSPVLTVTDWPAPPGIVAFVMDQGRVRFRLDDQAAADNGLVISSKLLDLAVSVTARKIPGAAP